MIRRIIEIDKEKCNGCGLCVNACHEGAIGMVDGKAQLLRDDYCDGLGNCLPACPTGAITFVEREALAYDQEAVDANIKAKQQQAGPVFSGCPGMQARKINQSRQEEAVKPQSTSAQAAPHSQLQQWPVQIKLVAPNASFFNQAHLLIAADCTAYAYANFHHDFMKNKITIIGCPKLDEADYSRKLTEILQNNAIKSVTVVRMEVPCCGGIELAAKNALQNCGKLIPWNVITISTDGHILED
jgi:Fe-S-cluster-containing hydrogenase component 2